ncbi:C-type lectin domain family 4 member K-like [Biomphalaria glabrata]|uniref:C-type lectin domain family 4 member K-like n=1 Tax=Biomphalaria glabrata TaxID=6526 RepID=A0A9W2YP18_BIOGL|nr:C-type lectin domain family 4 member K-like [Biomphalaria glabrata]
MTSVYVCFAVYALCVSLITSDSRLNFIANSEVIKELIQPLVMRCSIQTPNSEGNGSIAVTFMNILHETTGSLATVSKNNKYDPSSDTSLNKVRGYLSDQGSKESYLQITWTNPTSLQTGKYTCVARTRNYAGVVENLEATLTVSVTKTSFDDLVDVVVDVLKNLDVEKTKIRVLQEKLDKVITIPDLSCKVGYNLIMHGSLYACVWVSKVEKNYIDARDDCKEKGGHLLTLKTHEKFQLFLRNDPGRYLWIGLNDRESENTFRWEDDNSICNIYCQEKIFATGEPNNINNEDCAAYYPTRHIVNDNDCESLNYYMCEHPL